MAEAEDPVGGPRWRRRKDARPAEIAEAALAVFAEKGFAGARLEDIAGRAGLSKAALYRYYPTKTDLFRVVVVEAVAPNIDRIRAMAEAYPGNLADLLPIVLQRLAAAAETAPLGAVAKMVIGESRNFPDLARVWHDTVASRGLALIGGLVERAQARGEVRSGDPRLYAVSIMGPMLLGILWREIFEGVGGAPISLPELAAQHARTVLEGLLVEQRP